MNCIDHLKLFDRDPCHPRQAGHVRETVFASTRAPTHESFFVALTITDVAHLALRVVGAFRTVKPADSMVPEEAPLLAAT